MKVVLKKGMALLLALMMLLTFADITVFADGTSDAQAQRESSSGEAMMAFAGELLTGSFAVLEGYDIATIRYYTDAAGTAYEFADFSFDGSKYNYSFNSPYDGFTVSQGSEFVRGEKAGGTVIAEYFSTVKWDGAVDVSWYDPAETDFYISTPAQLAGAAAIVNGNVDIETRDYDIKGERIAAAGKQPGISYKFNLKYIQYVFNENASLIAGAIGDRCDGLAANDFSNKTIHITQDLDMGGVDGSQINREDLWETYTQVDPLTKKTSREKDTHNIYDYPNWMPMGGVFLYDISDGDTAVNAKFNGVLDGEGHRIDNLYCFRYCYKNVGDTPFGYAQGCGLIGYLGSLYEGEESPELNPSVKNLSLSGFVYGRRMVGGIVGAVGSGGKGNPGLRGGGGAAE